MKKGLKITAIIIFSLFGVILMASVLTKLLEDNLAHVAVTKLSKSIDAPIEIGSVNFNLVRGYPNSTIELNDLWLTDPDSSNTDTIAGIKHLYLSVNARAALKGQYQVEKIEIDGLSMNYWLNKDSLSNIDFLMNLVPEGEATPDTISDTTILHFNLNQLLLKNITCSYFDESSNTGAKLSIPHIEIVANIEGDEYSAKSSGKVSITDVKFGEYNMQLMKEASLDFNLDYLEDTISINTFRLLSDGIDISATGKANIGSDINVDAIVNGARINLAELMKYIPQEMMDEFGLTSAKGVFSFNSKITGSYNDSVMPRVDASFSLEDGAIKTSEYPELKHLSFAGEASNGALRNNATTSLDLTALKVDTENSSLDLIAYISNIDQPSYRISTKGSVLIDEFADYIPEGTVEYISGRLNWDMHSSGTVPKVIDDDFNDYLIARTWATLSVHNINTTLDSTLSIEEFSGELVYSPKSIIVSKLNIGIPTYDLVLKNTSANIVLDGQFADMDNMACDIKTLHLEFDNNVVDMEAYVSNLTNPDYTFKGKAKLALEDLQKFAPDTLVNSMSGVVVASISSAGYIHLDSIESQAEKLAFESTVIDLECKDVSVDMTDTLLEIRDLNLAMNMKPDTITVDNFSGNYKGLTFGVTATQIINAYKSAYLNQEEELTVLTSIEIGDVDYALFEPFMVESDTTAEDSVVTTNYTMDIKGDIAINSFNISDYEVDSTMTIRHLNLDKIATKFRVTDSTYIADSLGFNAFGGYMNTSLRYDLKPADGARISMRNYVDGMDFEQLLYDMDNFGQTDVTSENISGKLRSEVNITFPMFGDSIPMDKMWMHGDFELTNGRIVDFEAAQEMSKFTGIKELDDIQFQTLRTNLFVFTGSAYIPKTTIVNSAVDIIFFGKQGIEEDEFDYHLELNLGDIFTGKREGLMEKQAKADKEANEEVTRNGVNLYYGKSDGKIKKGFDSKKAMDSMEKKIRIQERFLNLVFHQDRIEYDTDFVKGESDEEFE